MARYKFKCVKEGCEKCGVEFVGQLAMADVGKLELYPRCECCGELTEKVFEATGSFRLKGGGWMNTPGGYSGVTHDVKGNPLGNSMQIGPHWNDRE